MIFGYCRVSTKGQAKDGNSLDYRKEDAEKYLNNLFLIVHQYYLQYFFGISAIMR
jgi:DNA invertase Pin-like site-specific DNA recombinase